MMDTPKICYAGIGSRETPKPILTRMSVLAFLLAEKGLVLRSGGADGADSAFEQGCDKAGGEKEIFLPWKKFNNNMSPLFKPSSEIRAYAAQFHPVWESLSSGVQQLHARNCQQVLGAKLDDPSCFILCWTNPGKGGTNQAIKVAMANNVPVINLALYPRCTTSDIIFMLSHWIAPNPMPLAPGPNFPEDPLPQP